jgi:hypothetical protein
MLQRPADAYIGGPCAYFLWRKKEQQQHTKEQQEQEKTRADAKKPIILSDFRRGTETSRSPLREDSRNTTLKSTLQKIHNRENPSNQNKSPKFGKTRICETQCDEIPTEQSFHHGVQTKQSIQSSYMNPQPKTPQRISRLTSGLAANELSLVSSPNLIYFKNDTTFKARNDTYKKLLNTSMESTPQYILQTARSNLAQRVQEEKERAAREKKLDVTSCLQQIASNRKLNVPAASKERKPLTTNRERSPRATVSKPNELILRNCAGSPCRFDKGQSSPKNYLELSRMLTSRVLPR